MDGVEARAQQAEDMVAKLKARLSTLRDLVEKEEIAKLTAENAKLQADVDAAKAQLRGIKEKAGQQHYPLPGEPGYTPPPAAHAAAADAPRSAQQKSAKAAAKPKADKAEKAAKPAKAASGGKGAKGASAASDVMDVSLLDFRVGLIKDASPHPESDKLYIENIETGSGTIVVLSGLSGKVPLEELQNRPVVLLMNLKPAKMGGIMSNAMVMCAGTDPLEVLAPPAGAVPGDKITFPGISGEGKEPASANSMKKKKILEQLLPDLKTDDKCVACYKGVPFTVEGKGVCTVKSAKDAFIK